MKRTPSSYDQLLELQRRPMQYGAHSPTPRIAHRNRYPENTLGPHEEVVQRRKDSVRKKVRIEKIAPDSRNILLENLGLLLVLVLSIAGLYLLTIHLLTHP